MVYLFENLSICTPQWLEDREKTLPAWRQEKVRAYKKQEDKVRSVAAFLLLEKALQEWGVMPVPAFSYGQWGKPYFSGDPVHFSLSHCQNGVVCALLNRPVGVDAQDKMAFSSRLAERICCPGERELLDKAEDRGWKLTALWTKKEALAKKTGKGLGENFPLLEGKVFTFHRPGYCVSVTEEEPQICIIEEL